MRVTRKPNPQLKQIVLEETNDGRDVVRYLKSTFMEVEDALGLFGLSPKVYARTHKIAAARILARIGLEEGKRYLRRNYVQTPFKRVHPEDEDLPRREMAAATSKLYRLVKKETNDGRDIIIRFVEIMKGYHPEYKPHLRLAAAKELIRHIEFDYDDDSSPSTNGTIPSTEPVGTSLVGALHHDASPTQTEHAGASLAGALHHDASPTQTEHAGALLVAAHSHQPNPVHPEHPVNPDSDKEPNPVIPASDDNASTADPIVNSKLTIENSSPAPRPHHDYAREHCVGEEESIYRSIIRRAAEQPDLDSACREAQKLIADFNQFATDRNPQHRTVVVPDDLLARSLTQRMEAPETYLFEPADYYDLDRDDFYYCLCRGCDECEEVEFFMETMRELEEETDHILEDP